MVSLLILLVFVIVGGMAIVLGKRKGQNNKENLDKEENRELGCLKGCSDGCLLLGFFSLLPIFTIGFLLVKVSHLVGTFF